MGMDVEEAAIQFRDVYKQFEDNHVLNGLTVDIPWKRVTTILGPSGCGKSVTLKHIIGILKADEGTVTVIGNDMSTIKGAALLNLRKQMGVLFQSAALFDSMNVFENVAFGLRMHTKFPEDRIRDRVAVCLEEVTMSGSEQIMPVDLSGGMRKRVALARAIALEPEFILYDEPTTGLDPKTSNVVGDLILKLQSNLDITSIVVTHDIPLTTRISDKIALIDKGVVAASGTPAEVELSPVFRQFVDGELGTEDEA
jgi:phospholipid/cholesterol/gamma-HCH transport system ATP-binding protein